VIIKFFRKKRKRETLTFSVSLYIFKKILLPSIIAKRRSEQKRLRFSFNNTRVRKPVNLFKFMPVNVR